MSLEKLQRKNFKPIDFFTSEVAKKNKINNFTDNQTIIDSLSVVADKIQEVRDLLDFSIIISSAYRNPQVNDLVKGKKYSQHLYGQAIDFICPSFGTPKKIVLYLQEKNIEVDQCLIEKSWVHLSIKKRGNRKQFGSYIKGTFKILTKSPQ